MAPNPEGTQFTINGEEFTFDTPVDGIALTPDGLHLYFCPLSGFLLYRLPTSVAQVENHFRLLLKRLFDRECKRTRSFSLKIVGILSFWSIYVIFVH